MAWQADWTVPRTFPSLGGNEVHVWLSTLDATPSEVAAYFEALSPDERERANRFRFEAVRTQYVKGRWLLRLLLSRYLGVSPGDLSFRTGVHGKPELETPAFGDPLHFNLSHSGGLALFAFARGLHLGVDIERVCPETVTDGLIRHVFSPAEQRVLFSLPPADRVQGFFNGWTRKEAYIKGRGCGLYFPLQGFTVRLHPAEPAELIWVENEPEEAARWTLRNLPAPPGYAAAVAVAGRGWSLSCFRAVTTLLGFEQAGAS